MQRVGIFGEQRVVGTGKGGEDLKGLVGLDLSLATGVMAAGGSRARADYDYLIKLLLIGDSGMHCVLCVKLRL